MHTRTIVVELECNPSKRWQYHVSLYKSWGFSATWYPSAKKAIEGALREVTACGITFDKIYFSLRHRIPERTLKVYADLETQEVTDAVNVDLRMRDKN